MSTVKDTYNKLKQTIVGTKTSNIDTKLDNALKDISSYKLTSSSNNFVELMRNLISKQSLGQFSQNTGLFSHGDSTPASLGQGRRLSRYGIYDSIISNISYCKRALDVLTGNILSPDDITKTSLEVKSTLYLENFSQDRALVEQTKHLISKMKIEENLNTIIKNTLSYGDFFCEVADSKTALTSKSVLSEHRFFSFVTNQSSENRETIYSSDNIKVTMSYLSFSESSDKEKKDDKKFNLNNLNLVFHDPKRVIKLQSELFPVCFGYLIFPKYGTMSQFGTHQDQTVNDICMNILKSLGKQIPQIEEMNDDEEIKDVISTMIKQSDRSQIMNIRYVPPDKMTHFMIPSTKYYPYGESIFDVSQFDAKVLMSLTTALAIQRLSKSTEKRKIGVEVGLPRDAAKQVEKLKEEFRKRKISLDSFGTVDTIPSMISTYEDIYIPQKDGKPFVDIDTLDAGRVDTRSKVEELEYLRGSIVAALGIPNAFLNLESELSNKCMDLCTKIPLTSGKNPELIDLINEYEKTGELKDKYTYSYDENTGKIVPGKIVWAGKTRLNAEVVKVTLDNKKSEVVTPDHLFMLRDGTYKQAQYLNPGDSLMPLYTELSHSKTTIKKVPYLKIYHPGLDEWEFAHRTFAKQYNLIEDGDGLNIHHCDFNPMNNNPTNLSGLNNSEHLRMHIEHRDFITTGRGNVKLENYIKDKCVICDKEYIKHIANNQITCLDEKCKKERARLDGIKSWKKREKNYTKIVSLVCPYCGKEFERHESYISKITSGIITCGNKECKRKSTSDFNNRPENKRYLSDGGKKGGNISKEKLVNYNKEHGAPMKGRTKETDPDTFIRRRKTMIERYGKASVPYRYSKSKNHKVSNIEFLQEKKDTGDITIEGFHNFAVKSGVIVHNSVLSEENILFARTIVHHQKYLNPQINELIEKIMSLYDPEAALSLRETVDISFPSPRSLQYEREARYIGDLVNLVESLERIGVPKDYSKRKYLSQIDWNEVDNWETNDAIEKNLGSDEEEEDEFGGEVGGGF